MTTLGVFIKAHRDPPRFLDTLQSSIHTGFQLVFVKQGWDYGCYRPICGFRTTVVLRNVLYVICVFQRDSMSVTIRQIWH